MSIQLGFMSNEIRQTEYENFITLAGGAIRCRRCLAKSVRSGRQCAKPAMKSSKTQKCTHHGGRSIGPQTEAGRQRIAAAHTTHGEKTKLARQQHSKDSAKISMLEDSMFVLGMGDGKRLQGRKANGYRPLRTIEEVREFLLGINSHHM